MVAKIWTTARSFTMRRISQVLSLTVFLGILYAGDPVAAADKPPTLDDDLQALQGEWTRVLKKGEKEPTTKIQITFKKDRMNLFIKTPKVFAGGSAQVILQEKGTQRLLRATKGLQTSIIAYKISKDSLILNGTIAIAGLGKHDLSGEWKRVKK
jgi:hypothetical protein